MGVPTILPATIFATKQHYFKRDTNPTCIEAVIPSTSHVWNWSQIHQIISILAFKEQDNL